MSDLAELTQAVDATVPLRQDSILNLRRDNTCAVSTASLFYPVYASPDDVDFQREEPFEAQFLPR